LSGQNYIAVGLTTEKQLVINGTAGDFFGALNNGAITTLKGNARRFVGDTMSAGGIIIQGNVQRGVGLAMSGGIIVIRGNVSGDIGQIAKGGTILVSGNCGPRSGAYMFNGELIVAGNVGKDTGLNMTGGTIFIGGKIGSSGLNTQVRSLTGADEQKLKKYFEHYGITKDIEGFKKILPMSKTPFKNKFFDLKTKPTDLASAEKTFLEKIRSEIINKAKNDQLTMYGPSFDGINSNFGKLAILPTQVTPIKNNSLLFDEIELSQSIGHKVDSPLSIEIPIILSTRGTGIISKSCKMAHIFAAAKLNTVVDIGGGISSEELELKSKHKGKIIHHWDSARLSTNIKQLTTGNAIQIELGVGGAGSLQTIIPSSKIIGELNEMWNLPEGTEIILPPKIFDFDVPADLKRHVELLQESTEHRIPVLIKLAAGDVYEDVKLAARAGPDAIVLEGIDAYHQNLPTITSNNLGLPALASISQAVRAMKASGADKRNVKLIISGLFSSGADVFKTLAMGADAVAINKAAEIALGCTLCGQCNLNICSEGIATTHPEKEIKLDWVEAGQKLVNFFTTINHELKLLMVLAGLRNINDFKPNILRALDYDTAAVTGVPLAGFNKTIPMWEH
jgi:glutamate synthase domain-containing protein 2